MTELKNTNVCKHNYVAEKIKEPIRISKYLSSSNYDNHTLDIEKIVIFCTKCGDAKYVEKTVEKKD